MDPRLRIVVVMVAIAGLAGTLVLLSKGDAPIGTVAPSVVPVAPYALSTPRECTLPERVAKPAWMPKALVLPAGTYTTQDLPASGGLRKALFLARGTLDDFVKHVQTAWPERGWLLGRGESEPPLEAEGTFERGKVYGQFRAQQTCAPGWTALLLVIAGLDGT